MIPAYIYRGVHSKFTRDFHSNKLYFELTGKGHEILLAGQSSDQKPVEIWKLLCAEFENSGYMTLIPAPPGNVVVRIERDRSYFSLTNFDFSNLNPDVEISFDRVPPRY